MHSLETLLTSVEKARTAFIREASNLNLDQSEFKPTPDSWSIKEIVEHIVWAERVGVFGMWKAADATHAGRTLWEGENVNVGLSIEEVVQKTWQPKEKVPDVAKPKWGGPVAYWLAELAGCSHTLASLMHKLDGMDPKKIIYPHPISGPLHVLQRLEFLRFHMDRHREQIKRVKADPGFPRL